MPPMIRLPSVSGRSAVYMPAKAQKSGRHRKGFFANMFSGRGTRGYQPKRGYESQRLRGHRTPKATAAWGGILPRSSARDRFGDFGGSGRRSPTDLWSAYAGYSAPRQPRGSLFPTIRGRR